MFSRFVATGTCDFSPHHMQVALDPDVVHARGVAPPSEQVFAGVAGGHLDVVVPAKLMPGLTFSVTVLKREPIDRKAWSGYVRDSPKAPIDVGGMFAKHADWCIATG